MSKFNLKDHKGTVIFTSVVAGAALAPILTGQMHHEDQKGNSESFPKPLSPSVAMETYPQLQGMAVMNNPQITNQSIQEATNGILTANGYTERQILLKEKHKSLDDAAPLRLVSKDTAEPEETQIATETLREMRSVWPEDTLLALGDEGPKVETIQGLLKEIGYYIHDVDGEYNTKTRNAVRLYQKEHGLMIDGIVGKETIDHLVGTKSLVTEPTANNEEEYSPIYVPQHSEETHIYISQTSIEAVQRESTINDRNYYKYGDIHEDVIELQELLNKAGYYSGTFDGIYGSNTQQAVRLLQREQNLTVDGLAGKEVFNFLHSNDLKKIADNRQAVQQNSSANTSTSNNNEQISPVSSTSMDKIISRAHELIGSPYSWGGTSPAGFDCSGFLVYVFNHGGKELPRTVSDIWAASTSVSSPSVGDLVFFETYKPGPSHAGIYLGDGAFIHTGSSGTTISYLDESYWKNRYLGAKRY